MEKRAKNLLIFSYVITISTQWCGIMYATPMSRAKYNEAQWAVLAHPTAVRQYFIGRSPRTSVSEFSTAGYRIDNKQTSPCQRSACRGLNRLQDPSRERSVCGEPIPTSTNFPLPAKRPQGPQPPPRPIPRAKRPRGAHTDINKPSPAGKAPAGAPTQNGGNTYEL